jgi:hypothetical protein
VKRYATIQSHDLPRFAVGKTLPQAWARRAAHIPGDTPVHENQIIRGLVVGLPLAIALWLVLALLVWLAF